jgi:FkbM family methyltransferase
MILAKALRWYLRTGLRGRTRLTAVATRYLPPLWSVPIRIKDCAPLYVDLRSSQAQYLLQGEPWPRAPWEQAEQDVMRRVVARGDVVLDIGANIGLHAVLLSRLIGPGGKLFLFEPNAALLPILGRTVHGMQNAWLHAYGLSDQTGSRTLFVPADDTKASFADWTDETIDGKAHEAVCEQRRLDDLVKEGAITAPDFIKCDVEGAELLVFRGAKTVLDRPDAPIILFEVNGHTAAGFGFAPLDAKEFLESLPAPRYRFFALRSDGTLPRIDTLNRWANVLGVPESKVARFPELR